MPITNQTLARSIRATMPALFCVAALAAAGCDQAAPPTAAGGRAAAHGGDQAAEHDHDAHDHAAGDHDHGAGPHGGTLADWGGGRYHVEFSVDHDAKQATIHVLGADAKTPAVVSAANGKLLLTIREPAFQVDLLARPQTGETAAAASRYVGTHESLGVVREFAGTISGEVDGTPFAGEFVEQAHDHD